MSKLANLRKGIPNHKIVDFPGTNEKVAIVELNNDAILRARINAVKFIQENPMDSDSADLVLDTFVLLEAMKNPADLSESFADSFAEINGAMKPKDIYELHGEFLEVQNGKTPEFTDITGEELEEIKKKLETMELKDLGGELQTILKFFHQTLISKTSRMDN